MIVGPFDSAPFVSSHILSSDRFAKSITIQVLRSCGKGCGDTCNCGSIARLKSKPAQEPPLDEAIAVVAFNTEWLIKVNDEVLLEAAEALLDSRKNITQPHIKNLMMVIAYNEDLLVTVRRRIGSTNMWDTLERPSLLDFAPVVLGS